MADIHVFSGLGSGVVERYREGNATNLASLKADFPKPVTRQQFVAALKRKMRG